MSRRPDFLGIGSQKCGTSWLYRSLALHPQVRFARRKELNYFYRKALKLDWSWYQGQLAAEPGTLVGDITPNYCKLKPPVVATVRRLLPEARLIFLIRNPIDRTWKQALYEVGYIQKEGVSALTIGRLLRHFERQRSCRYTDYVRAIRTWRAAYGEEPLLIELYDRVVSDPNGVYRDVLRHLGADASIAPPEDAVREWKGKTHQRLGLSKELEMPEEVRWYLATRWLPMVRELNELMAGGVAGWLEELEAVAGDTRTHWRLRRALNRCVMRVPEAVAYAVYDTWRDGKLARRLRQAEADALADTPADRRTGGGVGQLVEVA